MVAARRLLSRLSRSRSPRSGNDDALESQLVWMVGSPRTGSTWLLNLLALHPRVKGVDEPLLGAHLGVGVAALLGLSGGASDENPVRVLDRYATHEDYFFSARYREVWAPALRALVLARLGAQFGDRGGDRSDFLVIKEPHGSEGADLLSSVLPRSRMLAVVRDGRDVVDSVLDAVRPGAWAADIANVEQSSSARRDFLETSARLWVHRTGIVLRAVRERGTTDLLVRYEDLLADTAMELGGIYRWLGVPVPDDLADHVERLAFDTLPAAARGSGRFARAATPGLWREHFSAEEQRVVTEIMGPLLDDLGYEI